MKNSLTFLRKIKKNNNTEWMHAHKDEYLTAKKEFEFLVQEIIARVSMWDEKLPMLEPKDTMFRFNRDIRFSENKKPYKENFGSYISYDGKKGKLPGYYLHVSPTEVFVAGGLWYPGPDELSLVRKALAEHGDVFEKILSEKKFKRSFGELSTEHTLKRIPKGYSPDHEYAGFLKLKSFTVQKSFSIADVTTKGFGKKVDEAFRTMKPMNHFLRDLIKGNLDFSDT
jgi:uncharacterized protein (TIGR02453 family)